MRRLLFLLHLLLVFSENSAQINSQHLSGTWEFIKSNTGNSLSEKNKHLVMFKTFSGPVVITIAMDTITHRVVSTVIGRYYVNPPKGIGHYNDLTPDSCVISEMYWVNDSLANVKSTEEIWFGIKIENHDIMYQTKTGSKDRETWMRNNSGKLDYLNQNVFGEPDTSKWSPVLPFKELNSKTLLVLRSKTKKVFVIPNAAFPKPFAFMKHGEIEPLESLLNSSALAQYGEKGRFGALVAWVSEAYFPVALKILKAQKNVQ
jgi:hypothetical protein